MSETIIIMSMYTISYNNQSYNLYAISFTYFNSFIPKYSHSKPSPKITENHIRDIRIFYSSIVEDMKSSPKTGSYFAYFLGTVN